MTDLQGYLAILFFFILGFTLIIGGNQVGQKVHFTILLWLLRIKLIFFTIKIFYLIFNKSPLLKVLLSYGYFPSMAFLGLFIGCLAGILIHKKSDSLFHQLLPQALVIFNLLTATIFATYFLNAISAIAYFQGWVLFFKSCGYDKTFSIFIIIIEIAGAVGILIKTTRRLAILILAADMLGATYTHFHNYFSRHTPDPLGNSLPSLIMLTVLILYMILVVKKSKDIFDVTVVLHRPESNP